MIHAPTNQTVPRALLGSVITVYRILLIISSITSHGWALSRARTRNSLIPYSALSRCRIKGCLYGEENQNYYEIITRKCIKYRIRQSCNSIITRCSTVSDNKVLEICWKFFLQKFLQFRLTERVAYRIRTRVHEEDIGRPEIQHSSSSRQYELVNRPRAFQYASAQSIVCNQRAQMRPK